MLPGELITKNNLCVWNMNPKHKCLNFMKNFKSSYVLKDKTSLHWLDFEVYQRKFFVNRSTFSKFHFELCWLEVSGYYFAATDIFENICSFSG